MISICGFIIGSAKKSKTSKISFHTHHACCFLIFSYRFGNTFSQQNLSVEVSRGSGVKDKKWERFQIMIGHDLRS